MSSAINMKMDAYSMPTLATWSTSHKNSPSLFWLAFLNATEVVLCSTPESLPCFMRDCRGTEKVSLLSLLETFRDQSSLNSKVHHFWQRVVYQSSQSKFSQLVLMESVCHRFNCKCRTTSRIALATIVWCLEV